MTAMNRINKPRINKEIALLSAKRLSLTNESKKSKRHSDKYAHICVIVGKNIVTGTNRLTQHFGRGCHAEVNALKKLLSHNRDGKKRHKNRRKKKIDLIVCRLKKNGDFGSSKPCYHCLSYMNQIHSFRVNRIYYTKSDGTMTYNTFKNMFNVKPSDRHVSSGNTSWKKHDNT